MSNSHHSSILGDLSEAQLRHKQSLMQALRAYVPESALELCCELVMYYRLNLHIEVERKGRYGDYHPTMGPGNRITVNHNLNPFEFLLTFIHELAHHTTYLKYGNSVEAHGKEWKDEFKKNMFPFMQKDIFPNDLKFALISHMRNPKYSHSADVKLLKVLMNYDKEKNYTTLDELREGELFKMSKRSKIILKKLDTMRTYTNCIAVGTGRKYQVHTLAKIVRVSQDELLKG
jgi:hypothetical protein